MCSVGLKTEEVVKTIKSTGTWHFRECFTGLPKSCRKIIKVFFGLLTAKVLLFPSLHQHLQSLSTSIYWTLFSSKEKKKKKKRKNCTKKINPAFVLDKTRSAFPILAVSFLQCVSYKASSFQWKVFIKWALTKQLYIFCQKGFGICHCQERFKI